MTDLFGCTAASASIATVQVDELCDRFEAAWKAGQEPGIEEYLAQASKSARLPLLRALILLDAKHRRRVGRPRSQNGYRDLFPEVGQPIGEHPTRDNRMLTLPALSTSVADKSPVHHSFSEELVTESVLEGAKFHARGGLGVVYVASDRKLHRRVALKLIREELAGQADYRERFSCEAEITGRLEHPGVVPVYGLGETASGRPFYAMRLIDGETLESAIRRSHRGQTTGRGSSGQGLEFRNLLHCFVAVCKTVAYAHNRGIIHRDVKPENVMLGRYGETLVVDWGLAASVVRNGCFKKSDEKTLVPNNGSQNGNGSGGGAGTPAYMSPEQFSGLAPTPADDIYSLGVTLYRVLTGQLPYPDRNFRQLEQKVVRGEFRDPSQVNRTVPRPLEAICLKAMALHPQDRYRTALDLARDVERHLADEPVSAYAERGTEKLARWARRHRTAVKAGLLGLCGVVLVAVLSAIWLADLARGQKLARLEAERSQKAAEGARRRNLKLSAQFAARTLGQEIDLRWRILESEGNSPKLREMLGAVNSSPQSPSLRKPLQSWLEKRYIAQNELFRKAIWWVNAADGTQVARVPEASSIGNNYAHRDYFHGAGHDLPKAGALEQPAGPLDKPTHMSAVFESTNTKTLMVAFSVPIWSDSPEDFDRRSMGVLVMAVELGDFEILRSAILVDTREDRLGGDAQSGLVLHHPQLGRRNRSELPPRLDKASYEHAVELRDLRRGADGRLSTEAETLTVDFRDPVAGESGGAWLAAFEPVIVKGRSAEIADTGWVVIVEDRKAVPGVAESRSDSAIGRAEAQQPHGLRGPMKEGGITLRSGTQPARPTTGETAVRAS